MGDDRKDEITGTSGLEFKSSVIYQWAMKYGYFLSIFEEIKVKVI